MSDKERKPLKEALAVVTDGLDVLVGLEKEEEKEKKEERPPADTFSGLLQGFVPLMIFPAILPLFQQALGQTLSSTTVNVRVESATSIIPIDITATTAIVPIEIRASQVTLNVKIIGDANIVITGQNIDVKLSGVWHSVFGMSKRFFVYEYLSKRSQTVLTYTVPPNKRLVITNVKFNVRYSIQSFGEVVIRYPVTGWVITQTTMAREAVMYIYRGDVIVYTLASNIYQPLFEEALPTPLVFLPGQTMRVEVGVPYPATTVVVEVNGYEEEIQQE